MKKIYSLILIFSVSVSFVSAQFLRDNVSGAPYIANRYTDIIGSPLLFDTWNQGTIYLKDGTKAENFPLKFNVYENQLIFSYNDQALTVQNPVKEFVIATSAEANAPKMAFRCGYAPIEKNDEKTYYQVLQDGPVALLKQIKKMVVTNVTYGGAENVREFSTTEAYFVALPRGDLARINKNKSSLIDALGDNKGNLDAWMRTNNNKGKTEADLIAAVKAWNENQWK